MFCSECGTKVNDNAKFCFNCGVKIGGGLSINDSVNVEAIPEKKEASKEYTAYINKKVIEAYLQENDVTSQNFYSKALYYEMMPEMVDEAYNNAKKLVRKLNGYIEDLYSESHGLTLSEEQISEFVAFGKSVGIKEDTLHSFLEFYTKHEEIEEKRAYLELILEKYAETGKIDNNLLDAYDCLKSISPSELFEYYLQQIIEMEKVIGEEYQKSGNNELTESQIYFLKSVGLKKHFVSFDIERLIFGYEKKSGIYARKQQEKKDTLYRKLEQIFSKSYAVYGGIKFGAKYFLLNDLKRDFMEIPCELKKSFNKLDKSAKNAAGEVVDKYSNFDEKLFETIEKWEETLELNLQGAVDKCIAEELESGWDHLAAIQSEFASIEDKENAEKEYRKARKESRGRWQGGGFGVKGAIKGAVTASAMNAAGGLAHSAFNMIGNTVSSASASRARTNSLKEFVIVIDSLERAVKELCHEIIEQVNTEYPEMYFTGNSKDTEEEYNLRKSFRTSGKQDRELIVNQLLNINPYNPMNGADIIFEYFKNPKSSENMDIIGEMDKQFTWTENLVAEIGEWKKEYKIANEENDIKRLSEKWWKNGNEYLEILSGIEEDVFKELFNSIQGVVSEADEKKKHLEMLQGLHSKTVDQILDIYSKFRAKNCYAEATEVVIEYANFNQLAKSVLLEFSKSSNTEKTISSLNVFFANKNNIQNEEYSKIMKIFVAIKNEFGKPMLAYAVEGKNETAILEMLSYGADLNVLFYKYKSSTAPVVTILDSYVIDEWYTAFNGANAKEWNIYKLLIESGAERYFDSVLHQKYIAYEDYESLGDYIYVVCEKILTEKNSTGNYSISKRKLTVNNGIFYKAKERFRTLEKEEVHFILDDTIFGSGKKGFAIAESGLLSWSNLGMAKISWELFSQYNTDNINTFLNGFESFNKEHYFELLYYLLVEIKTGNFKISSASNEVSDITKESVMQTNNIEKNENDLLETSEYILCTSCGKSISRLVKFCNYCGVKNGYKG